MKPHKWHKEIKAWADGAKIEWKYPEEDEDEWAEEKSNPDWEDKEKEYRIKPQPNTNDFWDDKTLVDKIKECCKRNYVKISEHGAVYLTPKNNQPKEPQYLYVWRNHRGEVLLHDGDKIKETPIEYKHIGKIKLEVEDGN
jgi:hypothetical protein